MLGGPLTRSLPLFSGEPSDEELSAFLASTLSHLDSHLRRPDVIDEVIRRNRELWVMAYRASLSAAASVANQPSAGGFI